MSKTSGGVCSGPDRGREAPGAPLPPGRSSPCREQMAASRSRLTCVLSHLSGKSDCLFPTVSAEVPEKSLVDSGPPASQPRRCAVLFLFSGHLLSPWAGREGAGAALPKHEAGPRTGSRGSQRKVWDLPAGDGEKKAGRSRQASQGRLCPGAAVTDCHKPASHRVDLLSYSSGARVLNSGRQSCVPSGGSRKESLSLPFLASTGCLRSLARGPFLQITSLSLSVTGCFKFPLRCLIGISNVTCSK